MDVVVVTQETEKWFRPIIPARFDINDSGTYILGAVSDGTACGVLVCELNDVFLSISHIAVSPEFRRQGVASAMLRFLCETAAGLTLPVLCTFEAEDKTDSLYLFFAEAEYFTMAEEEGFSCYIPFGQVKDCYLSSLDVTQGKAIPFFSMSELDRRKFFSVLQESGIPFLEDIEEEELVKPLCLCYKKDGKIVSAVFVRHEDESDINLCFVYNEPGNNKRLVQLFAELRREALGMYGEETKLYIEVISDTTIALVNKIFPERVITGGFYTASFDMEEYFKSRGE